jgi:signal transduction histidine kinase
LLEVSETEKTNLARELHDELGSLLTAISMDLAGVKRQVAVREPALAEQLEQTIALVQSTTQIKRRIMEGLHPSSLDSMGLAEALRTLCDDFSARSGIHCQSTASADFSKLDESMSIALYRIVQEALTNVAKHASADNVTVTLSEDAHALQLEVADDGSGFDTDLAARRRTHGLSGMRERVAYFDGQFDVVSTPTGTRIRVSIPQHAGAASGAALDLPEIAETTSQPAAT